MIQTYPSVTLSFYPFDILHQNIGVLRPREPYFLKPPSRAVQDFNEIREIRSSIWMQNISFTLLPFYEVCVVIIRFPS